METSQWEKQNVICYDTYDSAIVCYSRNNSNKNKDDEIDLIASVVSWMLMSIVVYMIWSVNWLLFYNTRESLLYLIFRVQIGISIVLTIVLNT